MTDGIQQIGVIGLGRIGGGLSLQALKKGIDVVGYDLEGASSELLDAGMTEAENIQEFSALLTAPRIVFLYIHAGPPIDETIDSLAGILEPGDVIVDGGNSYWGDSIRRHDELAGKGIHFVDLGTSGGVMGAKSGACFMAGGDDIAIATVEPILRLLAVEDGYVHAGPPGAGHFTKLVHNGIEFGMLQAIGEGIDLLSHFHHKLDIAEVVRCWRHGSVIRGWLVDLMEEALRNDGDVHELPSHIEDTGEVNWLVGDAMQMEVPIPVISQAVMQLFASRDTGQNWASAVAMMRHGFGGHPYGPDESIARDRATSRVDDIFRPQKVD